MSPASDDENDEDDEGEIRVTWLDWFEYYFQCVVWVLLAPFRLLNCLVGQLWQYTQSLFSGKGQIFQFWTLFTGLMPPSVWTLISVGLIVAILLRILGR